MFGSTTSAAASASAAATSASNAATSASNASTSASNASASATAAAASYDSFDDRYLGPKASAPSVDNDGNALLTGALYWNSTSNELYLWTGSAWTQATLTAANFVDVVNNQTVAGIKTLSSAPVLSSLTASRAVFTDGTKTLVSNGITGTGDVVMSTSPTLITPALGTPTSGNFSTGTFTFPTFNQNTTGNAATATNVDYSGLTGTVPTWNQNTTGTAANVTGIVAIANGGTNASTVANAQINLQVDPAGTAVALAIALG